MQKRVRIPDAQGGGDIEFTIRPAYLTREYVEMQMLYVRIEAGGLSHDSLIDKVRSHIVGVENMKRAPSDEALTNLVGTEGVYALATEICVGSRVPDGHLEGVRKLLEVAHRSQDYDPNHDPPCECRECAGDVAMDPLCLYRFERPALSDVLANHDWNLISECWDQPFYVYQLRNETRRAETRGQACIYQEEDRRRANEEEAAKIREKRLGTRDWHAIAKERGA